ncbi:hypothetical protein GA0070618_2187 [Micromonospora echinospora]|uniref:Uncharacterized protein n=2 Tax=Micromonospora echinospora TaxID=1877 RepID=A0A1C4WGU9_MICEC|nr:hypothetical protein GA0070618_2187 [Micromonospora echinospora]
MAVTPKKTSARVEVRFLDDPDGRTENVPGSRLRVPWAEVAQFDATMSNWQRLNDLELDNTEQACVEEVFQLLIAEEIAEIEWSPVECATRVSDMGQLSSLIRVPAEEVLASAEWFDLDGDTMISPAGTLLIAEAACRANPTAVLDHVIEEEAKSRHKCKHGDERSSLSARGREPTTPEWEYHVYRRFDRPRHELLRQWCGHRAVTTHERLLAAEAETQRLNVLVTRLIKVLEQAGDTTIAAVYAEEHDRERITPATIRPFVDRPLHPSEIPVREIRVRRRWGY